MELTIECLTPSLPPLKVSARPPVKSLFGPYYVADLILTADRDPKKQVTFRNCFVIKRGSSHVISLPLGGSSGAFEVGAAVTSKGVELMHAVDGSLIVAYEKAAAGVVLIVPLWSTSVSFARFERMPD